ncbi:MAG: hypothetical protein F9K40_11650 [Kofleriaceae bacterium]|nr:MAG: hypothetical protein F9K40_11650 [Kofleriaceae bacterium]MBZ0235153.1 hypothetical protein [Kofleriaceae bacterium]
MTRALVGIALALALAACEESKAQAPGDDELVAAWKKAGLDVSAFTDADAAPYSAQACRSGTVGGVDVTICSYDTGEDAAAAQDPALALLEKGGAATASALVRGKKLLVVNDKRKADPSGKSINAITGAFRK